MSATEEQQYVFGSDPMKVIHQTCRSTNLMTPEYVTSGWIEQRTLTAFELTTGHGMNGQKIYGVTVRSIGIPRMREFSKLCGSFQEATDYIEELQERYGENG